MLDLETIIPELERQFAEVEARLGSPDVAANPRELAELGRRHHDLDRTLDVARRLRAEAGRAEQARRLLVDPDPDMAALAAEDLADAETAVERLTRDLQVRLVPPDPRDGRAVIIEIRAGTGGDEAALFAGDLFRMYSRLAERKGWKLELLSSNESDLGGFKEIIFNLEGERVWTWLQHERGTHRVQRVPATEAQGRIHTSAATVAVLPEAEETEIEIRPEDLRIDTFCSSGAGGQSVNTTYSAVRVVHIPTGMVVSCQDERSQLKNRIRALKVLRARLLEAQQEKAFAERSADRRSQVGSGDRSERVRTYNFPQNRLTDHRIGLTLYSLDRVVEGDLEPVLEALMADQQRRELEKAGLAAKND